MCMLDEIRARRDEIYAISRKHKAEKLWVFGCPRIAVILRNMRQFYFTFPKFYALRSELNWTHYRILKRIDASGRQSVCRHCAWFLC